MRWNRSDQLSRNIEDRRGSGLARGGVVLGGGGMLVLLLLSAVFGVDLTGLVGGDDGAIATAPTGQMAGPIEESPAERERAQFVSAVLDSVQGTWTTLLPRATGTPYRDARLVLFRGAVQSGCGTAQSAMGPFYCPLDERVYIDLGFYDELQQRFGAPGDFAQAYVIAHELGHHVQHILGIDQQVRRLQQQEPSESNPLSVRLELQADCLAGVWASAAQAQGLLEVGDVDEALNAAAAIGDDRLQRQATGRVRPESFTHGTSAQRSRWFRAGLDSGDPNACDTFDRSGR